MTTKTELTSFPALAKTLGCSAVYIKREDTNISGSHKDRAISHMLSSYIEAGVQEFVISSSGNATISAASYIANHAPGKTLHLFISPNISESKLERLDAAIQGTRGIHIHESQRAKSEAIAFAKEYEAQLIRMSQDDSALEGYKQLGTELTEQLNAVQVSGPVDVFVPTSSGTTAQGIHEGASTLKVHIVQTTKCNIMAREFDATAEKTETSLAHAIVDQVAHRKPQVIAAVQESGGAGWVISDTELEQAKKVLEDHTDIVMPSYDALLSLAGLIKARATGTEIATAVLVFTGK